MQQSHVGSINGVISQEQYRTSSTDKIFPDFPVIRHPQEYSLEEVRRLLEISDKYEGADDRARSIVAEGIRVTGFAAFSSTSPLTAQEQGKIREYFGQWMLLRDQLSGLITPYEHNTFLSAKRNFDSACTSKVSDQVKVAFLDQALEDAHSVYASQTKRTDISFSSVLNKIFLARTLRDLAAMGRFDDNAKRSAVALLWECADEIIKISKPDLEVEYCKESYLHEIEYFRGQYSEEIEINPEENPDISTHNILTKLNQSDIESGQNPNTFMESAFSPLRKAIVKHALQDTVTPPHAA